MSSYIQNLVLGLWAFIKTTRVQKRVIHTPERILIIHSGKLGDTVCATPMFRALHAQGFECNVASSSINKEVLNNNDHIKNFFLWTKSIQENIRICNSARPDVICLTTPNVHNLITAMLSRAKCVIAPRVVGGFSPYMTRMYSFLLKNCIASDFLMNEYVPQQYLNLLKPLGIESTDTSKYCVCTPEAKMFAQKHIKTRSEEFAIGYALGAGNSIKQWPIENFVKLFRDIIVQYPKAHFYIIGGEKEKEISNSFLKSLSDKELVYITDFTDKLSLDELKACISQFDLCIGVDTGPIYIAEAYNVQLVDIIGPV